MIRMHEISNKERVLVENIEDISSVKLGRGMNIIDLILPCVVCLFVFFSSAISSEKLLVE